VGNSLRTIRGEGFFGHEDKEDPIGVANRDYHYLSQFEIAGAKRISQHLSTAANCDSPKPIGLFGTVNANSTLCRGKPRVVPPALRASGSHF